MNKGFFVEVNDLMKNGEAKCKIYNNEPKSKTSPFRLTIQVYSNINNARANIIIKLKDNKLYQNTFAYTETVKSNTIIENAIRQNLVSVKNMLSNILI